MSEGPAWGDRVAVETLHGVPFRMYTERPRRVESLLALADRSPTQMTGYYGLDESPIDAEGWVDKPAISAQVRAELQQKQTAKAG